MAFEPKNNSGTLGENRKTKDNQPDMRGKVLVEGQWMWISAWWKKGNGSDFLSLSFEPMTPEQVQQYCGGSAPAQQPAPQPRQPQQAAPGYAGPPTGTYQANRAARAAGQAMPAVVPDLPFDDGPQFGPDDVPFMWSGRSTLPL